jgi:type I restriction enzyme S subunit
MTGTLANDELGLYSPAFPADWHSHALHDVADWLNGMAFRDIQFAPIGLPVIKIAEIKGGISGQTKLTNAFYDECYRIRPGHMLFSWSGQPETSIDVFWWNGPEGWLNQHVFKVTSNPAICSQEFLYYLLKYLKPHFIGIARNKQTTGLGHVTKADLRRLQVRVPDPEEQAALVALIKPLDDKIEQNRRTGAKLEGLARAVFKAWFVDFEPVKAKAAGATAFPGMPPETFTTLPTRFLDSSLGPVPEGWEVGTMGSIGVQRREQVTPDEVDGSTAYIGLEHMPRRDIALSDWGASASVTSSKFRFRRGDILFGKLRPYFHKVGRAAIDGVCSTDIVVLYPKKPEYAAWLLMLVSLDEFVAHTDRSSAGTKMPRTNWKDMAAFKTAFPPSKVVLAFQEQIGPMLDLITASIHESRRLAALRDYLLPKLLSGQVRVGEIFAFTENIDQ